MSDLIARLRLEATAGNSASVIGGVTRDVQQLGQSGTKAGAGLDHATAAGGKLDRELQQIATHGAGARRGLEQAEAGARGFERSASSARAAGIGLGTALAAIGGRELAGKITDAALALQGFDTGLSAVTGGAQGAAQAQGFIRAEAERMGLVVRTATADYMSLAAATNGTALAGENTRKIWLGLNEAGTVLNLTDERRQLAMAAISQMASKQVISQEELRGQLSEALPGAYQVAQRAMGLTSQEFNKLVGSGKLLADEFLPKLAGQLRTEFAPSVEQSLISPMGQARVEMAKFKNAIFDLEASAGGEFLGGMREGLAELNAELASPESQEAARALGRLLGEGLSDAASIAAFLAQNLNGIALAAQTVVGVGLARWIATTTIEARAAAAAYLLKSQTATAGAASATEAAIVEGRAVTSLRGAIEAAARAELQSAVAAREAALAREALTAATLRQYGSQLQASASAQTSARAQSAYAAAQAELNIAQNASAAASIRAEVAQANLARSTTLMGSAMRGASSMASGLVGLLGGPWGIAFIAAVGGAALLSQHLAKLEAETAQFDANTRSVAGALEDTAKYATMASDGVSRLGINSSNAASPTDELAKAMGRFADETYRAAAAQKTLAINSLMKEAALVGSDITRLEGKVKAEKVNSQALAGAMLGDAAFSSLGAQQIAAADDGVSKSLNYSLLQQRKQEDAKIQARIRDLASQDTMAFAPPKAATATSSSAGKPDRQELRAQIKDSDLAAAVAAQNAYTAALIAGGAALDNWKVQEAGRQAVERLALADRPKLTAAETALVASIRERAEETERLKIANERIEKSAGLAKSADLDTAALQRRSAAAVQGEAAMEALQVQEAGLRVLQQLGIDTLDQLTGETLKHAKAAIASAEASERQALATQKAERVAAQIRDLDKRLSSELAYTAALKGGTSALVEYQRAEFARQEIERAGTNLTDDQVVAIRAKADALFAAQAAADSAQFDVRQAEELRLARMTNSERAIEERYLQRKSALLAEHADWTQEEVEARARALALADQAAAEDAAAIGELKQGLEDAFVESGELGMDQVGDYAERALRQAVYKALLAEPINLIINAVVGSISGLTGSIGAAGAQGGLAGLGSLFNSAGGLSGLATGSAKAITGLLGKVGMGGMDAARFGGMAGGAIGGAGTGMLVSSLAGMLGLKQSKGNQIGGTIGGAIGSFIPIPGGSLIGSVLGNLVGGLVGGKKSNEAAVVSLDQKGSVTSIDGAKRTEATTAAAQSIASAVAQIQAALVAGGATLNATVSKIDIGQRDPTHLNFSNGQSIDTAVGDTAAAVEAATRTIIANAKWATQAQTDYAQKMLLAGASLDQVIATMQMAGGLSTSVDDAIAKLVDPAAYERKAALEAIETNYQALKKQAEELIAAGLATGDVLGKIDQLKDLEVADALKRLGEAADDAASSLSPAQLTSEINKGIASLTDPAGFKRDQALAEIDANITSMRAQATALVAAGKLSSDVFSKLDQLKDLQVADALKRLGEAADDAATSLSPGQLADPAKLTSDINSGIASLTDPTGFRRGQALAEIDANITSMRAQATALVAAGKLSSEVFTQLDQLKDLQVTASIKALGDAASDAAAKLQDQMAAGKFSGSIDDAILKVTNPNEYAKKAAVDGVNRNYEAMKAEATGLIAAGLLSGDVLGKLEIMRDLQIQDALMGLTSAAKEATDVFADARPRLRSWLDGLVGSNTNGLNADAELKLARQQYDRQIAMAQGGDADALSSITSYADRLLQADREATTDASARQSLYELITGQVEGLAQGSSKTSAANDNMTASFAKALASQPVSIANLPVFASTFASIEVPQTDRVVAAIEVMRSAVISAIGDLATSGTANAEALQAALEAGLNAIDSSFGAIAATAAQQAEALDELQRSQQLAEVYLRQQRASA
jgi:tape measure domain-containing protein